MRRILLILAILGAAASAQERSLIQQGGAVPPVQARSLVALAVGNAGYRMSPLTNPVNDAQAISGALRDLGFSVETIVDADYRQLGTGIDRFVHRVRRGDVAVFYYAGHGIQIEGENFLVPTDFDARDESSAKYAAYPADRLLEGMERSGAKLNIIILDACRNNPFRGSRAMSGGLAPMGSGAGTFVAFATSPGKTASDNSKGANGLFTQYLLESLRQPGLTLDEVFNRTRELVYTASKQSQIPWTQTNVIGKFYFRPAANAPTVTASSRPSPAPPKPALIAANRAYREGVTESRGGNAANAVEAFTKAIQENPEDMEAYHERAMSFAAVGQFQRAIDDFTRILQRNPSDTNALIGRGASYIRFNDYARAIPDLDRVIQREPDNDIAYFDRAIAHAGLDQNQKALDDYTRVTAHRPKWSSAWYNRGITHAALGDLKNALDDYSVAIRLRPDYAAAYANRGVAYAELGKLPEARADLDQAIRLEPADAAMFNSRGVVLMQMKNPSQALEDFNEAIRLNSLLGVAYSNRADARLALGDRAGAQADQKRARELGGR